MRALLVFLGICLLPAALCGQRVLSTTSAPRAAVVPVRRTPLRVCGVRFTVSVRCGFNPGRGYRSLQRPFGNEYNRFERGFDGGSWRAYEIPVHRVYYGSWPTCPAAVGGVAVVSPPNVRYSPQPGSAPPYTGYALVPLGPQSGCVR